MVQFRNAFEEIELLEKRVDYLEIESQKEIRVILDELRKENAKSNILIVQIQGCLNALTESIRDLYKREEDNG
jgi:hypothetical protein|tara:strand:+ start:2361 stop:2579 length:219 start_codon:yes stop_codon:yes gene_type:complete